MAGVTARSSVLKELARARRLVRRGEAGCGQAPRAVVVGRWDKLELDKARPQARLKAQLEISIPASGVAEARASWVARARRLEQEPPGLVLLGRPLVVDSINIRVRGVVAVRVGKLAEVRWILLAELRPVQVLKPELARPLELAGDAGVLDSR